MTGRPLSWKPSDWPLGRVPDTEIAKAVGVDVSTVQYHRAKAGIPAFNPESPRDAARILCAISRAEAESPEVAAVGDILWRYIEEAGHAG